MSTEEWDLVVVGAGPAGTGAALGALATDPSARVLLLDRSDFPRDKPCGDGVAPHVVDLLDALGEPGLLADRVPVPTFSLTVGDAGVERDMARPTFVVPRTVLDARLVEAAVRRGAVLRRHRVRSVVPGADGVQVDDVRGRVVVGADGAHSLVRGVAGLGPHRRQALAIRGYAPVAKGREARQDIVMGTGRQPAYAWSFDRGDGLANVGYGELLGRDGSPPTRRHLLDRLDALLPGVSDGVEDLRAHHLPLSGWRVRLPDGPLLLAGDAAGQINPMTGEGIHDALLTGSLAGRAAVEACAAGVPAGAGQRHRAAVRAALRTHVAGTAIAARLASRQSIVARTVRAARRDCGVFDDLVELGLAAGGLTPRVLAGLVRG